MKSASSLLLLLLLGSCVVKVNGSGESWSHYGNKNAIRGSGVRAEETREVEEFTAVELSVPGNVVVRVGEEASMTLSGDDNIIGHVDTEVRRGTLKIDLHEDVSFRRGLDIELTTPLLERFSVEGSADVDIEGLRGERFALIIEGSGDVRAAGEVDHLEASIEGSGDLELDDLMAREASLSIEGAGEMRVNVTEALHYDIEGSGDIRYRGSPNVTGGIQGSGSVHKK